MRDRDLLVCLTAEIRDKTKGFYPATPPASVVLNVLRTVFLATLRTEEGRFIRGSVTFGDPRNPDPDPPLLTRAYYPSFTKLRRSVPLTPESLVKLSRAIDRWSGSIAVYGTARSALVAWGVIDQLVQQNVRLNQESREGTASPGVLTVVMDGPGELSAYRGDLFLGGIRRDRLVSREQDAFRSGAVFDRIMPHLVPYAEQIARALNRKIRRVEREDVRRAAYELFSEWTRTVSRVCIALRRTGTGGALLITPSPLSEHLELHYELPYSRVQDSMILGVLDSAYSSMFQERILERTEAGEQNVPAEVVAESGLAETDEQDRTLEMSGAARLAASFAAVDGLVLLSPTLNVISFGTKIRSSKAPKVVYSAESFERLGLRGTRVDVGTFGTRHSSMLWYCRQDPKAIGVIVSQDGNVRVATTVNRSLVLWDDVKLLRYHHDPKEYLRHERTGRSYRAKSKLRKRRGYTRMPKTLAALRQVR